MGAQVVGVPLAGFAHYQCPDVVEFGPLPKTSTGKVQKFVLRDREWAGHDKRSMVPLRWLGWHRQHPPPWC